MDYYGKVAAGWGSQGFADLNQNHSDLGPGLANQQASAAAVGAAAGATVPTFPSFQKGPPLPFTGFGAPGALIVERPSVLNMAQGAGGLKVAAMAGVKKAGGSSSANVAGTSGKPGESRRKWAPNRKAAGFWSPFNDWWRQEFARVGRRPSTEDVSAWYVDHADKAWKVNKPSIKETRRHAKCLRTTEDVRNYFRKYRAKRSSTAQSKKDKQVQQGGARKGRQLHYPTPGTSVLKPAFGVKGVNSAAAVGLLPDATGVFDSVNSALNRAAWLQQQQGNAAAMAAQFNSGVGANASAQLNAMYRNYQQATQQTVPVQANQAAQLANTFAFIQNPSLVYQTANTVNLAGCNAALARNYMQAAQGSQPRQMQGMQGRQQVSAANPSGDHGRLIKPGDPAGQTTESPNSTETTEPVDRATARTPSPLEVAQAHASDAACLSSMISHIERSRSLTSTPTPIPWRSEEVSTHFQDHEAQHHHLDMQVKLEYDATANSIHMLAPAVVDSAESNEPYIDGL